MHGINQIIISPPFCADALQEGLSNLLDRGEFERLYMPTGLTSMPVASVVRELPGRCEQLR
jgi:hypothetical protein